MSALNEAAARTGGQWVKLDEEGASVTGYIISSEMTPRTDPEGNVVLARKSGNPRQVLRMRLATDLRDPDVENDDGVRIFDANESAQREIIRAYKASGLEDDTGAKFKIECTKVTGTYEQNEVAARFGDVDMSKVERFVADQQAAQYAAAGPGFDAEEPF